MARARRIFVALFFLTLLHHSNTPSGFAQLTRLKTSYSALTANMAAYWLAKETKLFEKHGLDVDVVLIENGTITIQALIAGETDIAMGGGTVAVSSALSGSDLVSIASIESRLPYGLLAQKEIKTLDQLKGKIHAISRFGSIADLGSRLIFQKFGLVPDKDVTLLQIGGTSTRLAALSKRTVDSTILTPDAHRRDTQLQERPRRQHPRIEQVFAHQRPRSVRRSLQNLLRDLPADTVSVTRGDSNPAHLDGRARSARESGQAGTIYRRLYLAGNRKERLCVPALSAEVASDTNRSL